MSELDEVWLQVELAKKRAEALTKRTREENELKVVMWRFESSPIIANDLQY
jgi:hypothetical protein